MSRPSRLAVGEGDGERITRAEALVRMAAAEDTLRAIGAGEVDAFVVSEDGSDQRVFALSSADRPYRTFVENMCDGAATLSEDGLVLFANERLAELLSCPIEAIVGSPLASFLGVDGPASVQDLHGVARVRGTVEIDLVDADGVPVPVLVGVSPLDASGDLRSYLTFSDLRAQKALEAQLRQAQKLEAIGNLAGGVAHDFNNLLTVIRGYSGILLRNPTDARSQQAAERIDQAAQQAAALTSQLLAFSRQQIMRPEVTDVNLVIEETLTLLERLLGEDILLEKRLDPGLAAVLVDRGSLAQVMLNLAVNARSAMAGGGKLAVHTENLDLDEAGAAARGCVVPGRYVLVKVVDSGTGMDDVTRARVFDPFFTTKTDGTGLGLSTVHGIVGQSGGHISVESRLGVGTTFEICFPAIDAPITAAVAPVEVVSYEGTETILVVEDNELLRVLLTEELESYGYTVLTAADGPKAVAVAAREHARPIQMLLTDVVMPGMDGAELAANLLVDRPGLRVLFTSGYAYDPTFRQAIAESRTAFIQKPYLADELARTVREVLASNL